MGFIPEDVLQQILDTADIRQIVQEYVALKKRGRNWVGLCPFHSDTDPSFSVSEDKQIFYCFGCGEGGDVFKFLMRIEGLSFVEAAQALAERYGIELRQQWSAPARTGRKEERQLILELNEAASRFFRENLLNPKVGVLAQEYVRQRGLSDDVVERFGLGWAEERWDGLVEFLQAKGFDLALAEKAGLVAARKNASGYYDRFRGRLIFPILDHRGKTVAFGGRIIASDSGGERTDGRDQPKYINSPESPVYRKGRVLYGLFQNRDAIRRASRGIVVEGYMDLISLHQAGVKEAVATLGTALTEEHVKRLKGLARNWILLFDADEAGRKAAKRALPLFYRYNLSPKVLSLPEGEDPDSYVRKEGGQRLLDLADSAPSGIDFLLESGRAIHGDGLDGRHQTAEDLLEVVKALTDPVRKSLIISHVSQRLGIRETSLYERLKVEEARQARRIDPGRMKAKGADSRSTPGAEVEASAKAEEKLVGFILSHPSVFPDFLDEGLEIWLTDERLRQLWRAAVNLYNMNGRLEMSALADNLASLPDLKALAMRLVAQAPPCSSLEEMAAALKQYCRQRRKKAMRQALMEQMRSCGPEEGEILLRQLQGLR